MTKLLLEKVARSLDLTVRGNIEAVIDSVWTQMETEDAEYYTAISEAAPPETPKQYPVSYYLGHHPSILQHAVDDYPNVVVSCYEHDPADGFDIDNELDQIEPLTNAAYVEAFVLHEDASTVNRIAWRYADALHRVITENRDLGEWPLIWSMIGTPHVEVSNSSARPVSEDTDEWTYIQGVRVEMIYRTPQPSNVRGGE